MPRLRENTEQTKSKNVAHWSWSHARLKFPNILV